LALVMLLVTVVACGSPSALTPSPANPPPEEATETPEGSTIYLPGIPAGGRTPSPIPTPTPAPTDAPTEPSPLPTPTPLPPPVAKPEAGVQVHLFAGDSMQTLKWAEGLGVGWVKQQVEWHTIEYAPGQFEWQLLDQAVNQSNQFGFKVLLSVVRAPLHLRSTEQEGGPPADYAEFRRFMRQLAERYRGRVAAYELWNEPNLRREWHGDTLDGARFVELVAEGAQGVREGDPDALVISGAPAVTGINDGETAVDDRVYMRSMLAAGVADWVDGVGVHPYGFANPPEASVEDEEQVTPGHNDHPSFFFRDTLEDYRDLMVEYEAGTLLLWPTEFGWPSVDGLEEIDTTGIEYARDVSEEEQAAYTVRAFEIGWGTEWIGPMFLWNLNISTIWNDTAWGANRPETPYSLLRPDGSYRPAYIALRLAGPSEE
jgi:hypothetical protein